MKPMFYSLYTTELIRLGIAEEQAATYFESMAPLCHSGAVKAQVYQLCAEANEQARQVSSVLATLPEPPHLEVTKMRPRIAEEIYSLTPSLDAFSISDATILDAVGHVHGYVHEQLRRTMAFANLIGENDKIQRLAPLYHDNGGPASAATLL